MSMDRAEDRPRVWIVDDSPLDVRRARTALEPDYELAELADGSAALERLAAEGPPDVLVLDWVMPGVSGLDVCRFLRSSPATDAARLPVLLLTVQEKVEQIVEGLQAGAN